MVSLNLEDEEVEAQIIDYLSKCSITEAQNSEAANYICSKIKNSAPKKYHNYPVRLSRGRTQRILDAMVNRGLLGKTRGKKYWLKQITKKDD